MKLNPLHSFKPPDYPAAEEKPADITGRFVPLRWLKPAVMAGAALFLLLSPAQPAWGDSSGKGSVPNVKKQKKSEYRVTITEHHTAGVISFSPVFSEADSRKLVEAEFAKHSITFEKHNHNVGTKDEQILLDGYSPLKKIAYKLVHRDNFSRIITWGNMNFRKLITIERVAVSMEEKLEECGIRCACIYVPEYGPKEEAKRGMIRQIKEAAKKFKKL
ncbi:MAG: hypothetical protein LWY06_07195 [Firmicutes bacterium]|nr:hypothetical protein [Bacillota bacterium]